MSKTIQQRLQKKLLVRLEDTQQLDISNCLKRLFGCSKLVKPLLNLSPQNELVSHLDWTTTMTANDLKVKLNEVKAVSKIIN